MRDWIQGWQRRTLHTASLAAALMLLMGTTDNNACAPDPGGEDECSAASDCTGVPPLDCAGSWSCEVGECNFVCDDDPPPAGCYGDQDCADGLVCNASEICLSPPGCEPGQPCPAVCYGYCVEPDPQPTGCYSDDQCGDGQHCSVSDGDCNSPPGCGGSEMACPAVCYGECVDDEPQGCQTDSDCGEGEICGCGSWFGDPAEAGQAGDAPNRIACFLQCIPDPDLHECSWDGDCAAGLVCVDGACAEPSEVYCWSDADCGDTEFCNTEDYCQMPPSWSGANELMACMGVCEEKPDPGPCHSDADCAEGEYCGCAPWMGDTDGGAAEADIWCEPMCLPEEPQPGECQTDSDCHPGEVCELRCDEVECDCDPSSEYCACPSACEGVCVEDQGGFECSSDADCDFGEYCGCGSGPWGAPNAIMCLPQCLPKAYDCSEDSDCGDNGRCEIVECEGGGWAADPMPCEDGSDCGVPMPPPPEERCFGYCEEAPPEYECSSDAECGPGAHCNFVICEAQAYACPDDSDCGVTPPESQCWGNCVADQPDYDCRSNDDCESGVCEFVICATTAGSQACYDEDGDGFCDNDQERPGGCWGYCQPPEPQPCGASGSCPDGYYCGCESSWYGGAEGDQAPPSGMPCFPVCMPVEPEDECGPGRPCADGFECVESSAGATCEPSHTEGCESNADCAEDEVCEFNICPLGPCWFDEDTGESHCPPCVGQCVPAEPEGCGSNDDCAPGQYCEIDACEVDCPDCVPGADCGDCEASCHGVCKDQQWPQECSSNEDCDEGESCQCTANPACPECDVCFFQCVQDDPPPPSGCESDDECPAGQSCQEFCPPCACPIDGDCPQCECLNVCADDHEPPPPPSCGDDADCPSGTTCECLPDPSCPMCDVCRMECVPEQPQSCQSDSDCAEGSYCEQGPCPFFMPCGPEGCPGCGGVCKERPPEPNPCMATGCSGQVCAAEPVYTTCEWQPQYACYQLAECAQNSDGSCGWQPSEAFTECMSGSGGFAP